MRIIPLTGDASDRRYFRVFQEDAHGLDGHRAVYVDGDARDLARFHHRLQHEKELLRALHGEGGHDDAASLRHGGPDHFGELLLGLVPLEEDGLLGPGELRRSRQQGIESAGGVRPEHRVVRVFDEIGAARDGRDEQQ
mgnify:CR=1 FL=1